jgi:hypothetical protein
MITEEGAEALCSLAMPRPPKISMKYSGRDDDSEKVAQPELSYVADLPKSGNHQQL